MKSCLFSFLGFFGLLWFFVVMFRPFNVIIFALFSLIMLFFEQEIYEIFSYVYFSISFFIFLCCIIPILTSGISQKLSSIHRKYYLAIHYSHGAEGFSFLCSTFALFNILWTIKMLYYGHWYFLIYTLFYYFLYNLFIGPRLNPFLFLGDRVNKGDINAYKELTMINSIKRDGDLSPFYMES